MKINGKGTTFSYCSFPKDLNLVGRTAVFLFQGEPMTDFYEDIDWSDTIRLLGLLHCITGPTVVTRYSLSWWDLGLRHRIGGPAGIIWDGYGTGPGVSLNWSLFGTTYTLREYLSKLSEPHRALTLVNLAKGWDGLRGLLHT